MKEKEGDEGPAVENSAEEDRDRSSRNETSEESNVGNGDETQVQSSEIEMRSSPVTWLTHHHPPEISEVGSIASQLFFFYLRLLKITTTILSF